MIEGLLALVVLLFIAFLAVVIVVYPFVWVAKMIGNLRRVKSTTKEQDEKALQALPPFERAKIMLQGTKREQAERELAELRGKARELRDPRGWQMVLCVIGAATVGFLIAGGVGLMVGALAGLLLCVFSPEESRK